MSEPKEITGLRKISVKTVVGRVPNPPEKGTKPLMMVWGQAQGYKTGESDYGDFTGLVGTFEAVNLETGELFAAPVCFLVGGFGEMIAQRFKDKIAEAVDFAFEIGVKAPGPDVQVRYEYVIKAIQDPSAADPLAKLRERIPAFKALPSPDENAASASRKK